MRKLSDASLHGTKIPAAAMANEHGHCLKPCADMCETFKRAESNPSAKCDDVAFDGCEVITYAVGKPEPRNEQ